MADEVKTGVNPMRILHVTCQKPDSTGSGVYLAAVLSACAEKGHKNAVVCGIEGDDTPEASLAPNTSVFPVQFKTDALPFAICGMSDVMPYEATRYRDLDAAQTELFTAAFLRALHHARDDFSPDVVICHHLYYVTALARDVFAGYPLVAICHSTDLRQLKQQGFMRDKILESIPKLDAIGALHTEQKDEITKLFDIPKSIVSIVGIGYDAKRFYPDPHRASLKNKKPYVLYVGKITFKKGIESLLRAFESIASHNPRSSLILVGGHSDEEEYLTIQTYAQSLDLPVVFTGKVSSTRLVELYQGASVFVLPSFFEGLPLVIAEALACGCRVVATDLPGVKTFYTHFLPDAPISFVKPPAMVDTDTPTVEDLPTFERNLARAIDDMLRTDSPPVDTHCLDWSYVAKRILDALARVCCVQD